jgi:hypothetical protein
MLFPTFDRACGYGLPDIGVGRKIPYLIEIFASSWGFIITGSTANSFLEHYFVSTDIRQMPVASRPGSRF